MLLKTAEAQKVLDRYIKKLDFSVNKLPAEMQSDIRNEILGHIVDSISASRKETELDQLLDAIDRLGDPGKFMKPMIADYEAEYATKTFNPAHIFRAMTRNIGAGLGRTIKFSVFFVLYTTLLSFAFIFLAKIFVPEHTGLFYSGNEFSGFGLIYGNEKQKVELLGYWLLPLSLIGFVLDYLLITAIMKLTIKKRK